MEEGALMTLNLESEKCTRCGDCVDSCPFDAIHLEGEDGFPAINDKCTLCGACVRACTFDALTMDKKARKKVMALKKYKDIWVYGEQDDGVIKKVVLELMSIGRTLAEKRGSRLCVAVLGHDMEDECQRLIRHGADMVYFVNDERLKEFNPVDYANALSELINDKKPEVVLAGATPLGRTFIPRVAVQVDTGLTADCLLLDIGDDGLLHQTRPAFGGNIMATIKCADHRPQMATVRPSVMKVAEEVEEPTGELEVINPSDDVFSDLLKWMSKERGGAILENIQDANIIVSGGKGVGGEKGFKVLFDLAYVLGAVVGASRAAVDRGWHPQTHQVGQTGKTVQPTMYIACGISGAVQHIAGIGGAETIIAINNDPEAAIFDVADYGIVGDLFEILPLMTKKLREMVKGKEE